MHFNVFFERKGYVQYYHPKWYGYRLIILKSMNKKIYLRIGEIDMKLLLQNYVKIHYHYLYVLPHAKTLGHKPIFIIRLNYDIAHECHFCVFISY